MFPKKNSQEISQIYYTMEFYFYFLKSKNLPIFGIKKKTEQNLSQENTKKHTASQKL
jgi:hypothetical protein